MSHTQKRHNRGMQRYETQKHIKRKERIIRSVYDASSAYIGSGEFYDYYKERGLHRLSKDKIHCSCPLCSEKTKNIGFKHSDLIKIAKGLEE